VIAADSSKGKTIALFGLGGSGLATARSLKAGGAKLYCHDDNPERVAKAEAEGLQCADLRQVDFAVLDALLLSPGVPLTHPKPHWSVDLASNAGVPIIGDIELFARERRAKAPDCPFIAITGTNGKSTTTALIAHVFQSAGRDVQLGGNIGTAVMLLDEPADKKVYVIECSSYQIDLAPSIDPSVGILLNLTPDHLDRHGTMAHYAEIKQRLVDASGLAVIGMDDKYCVDIADEIEKSGRPVIRIASTIGLDDGICLENGNLVERKAGKSRLLCPMADAPALRGDHNGQNAAAAWAACSASGLSEAEIRAGFAGFPGLAHRMEQVAKSGRVLFVNDSKATNADAAAHALASFERIYWIAGGLPKEGGIEPLRQYFPKIAKAFLIGEAAPEFAASLGAAVPYEISGTLDVAIARAAQEAGNDNSEEPVVLLSPACASFDQFQNFEVRGDAFRAGVLALKETTGLMEAMG
jgi:UDP-N-acetylmuramoylalanine--D-glutamate ligase